MKKGGFLYFVKFHDGFLCQVHARRTAEAIQHALAFAQRKAPAMEKRICVYCEIVDDTFAAQLARLGYSPEEIEASTR